MNVAVPLLQHSQWLGHFALSQTVCSRKSSRRARVLKKLFVVGSLMRSHSGRRTRGTSAVRSVVTIFAAAKIKSESPDVDSYEELNYAVLAGVSWKRFQNSSS